MAWSLEIHHLDIQSVGDATIIIAREPNNVPPVKVALIDGGKTQAGAIIQNYCNNNGIAAIDVVAVTHFDKDHFYGVTWLLNNTNLCDNAIIYDLGELSNDRKYTYRMTQGGSKAKRVDSDYQKYLNAIAGKVGVRHATKLVNSSDIVTYDVNHAATIPHPGMVGHNLPHWLIDKEIMWGDGMDGLQGRGAFASNPPGGAPTITCIAANKYVRQNGGGVRFVSEVNIFNGPNRMSAGKIADEENRNENAKSLGFMVAFNNFKYYVAGDLESAQEDGHNNVNTGPPTFQPGVMTYVNNADNTAGRVLAMKTSHHGASTASSRAFISRMRPSAAFISTGASNQFSHPAQPVINVLDGYPAVPILGDPNNRLRHPSQPPIPPFRPLFTYYLTGFQSLLPLQTYGGDVSETAGVPANGVAGDIRLEVSAAQSQRAVDGQIYRGILAAATQTAAAVNLVVVAANIAEKGASRGTAAAVAEAVGAPAAAAVAAVDAAAHVGDDANGVGVVSAAVAAAGGGAVAAATAAANVAGGARVNAIGAGVAAAIGEAVTGGNAAAITLAAQNAGASQNAATAAGHAAHTVSNTMGMGADDAGFAAAAAIGAVIQGATVAQAAAIAAAIAATVHGGNATSALTATMTANAAIAAGMANASAALGGAVAGASWWLGLPNEVAAATTAALIAGGFNINNAAANAGNAAQLAATIANNDLFNVHFVYDNNGANANGNVAHTS